MLFHRQSLKATTAVVTVLLMLWAGCGGQAWAESCLVESNPGEQLARWADDPRLRLSDAERDYLRNAAARLDREPQAMVAPPARFHAERTTVLNLEKAAAELDLLLSAPAAKTGTGDPLSGAEERARTVEGLAQRLDQSHREVLAGFDRVEAMLKAAGLPPVIFERQAEARAEYLSQYEGVMRSLQSARTAESDEAIRVALSEVADRLRLSTDQRPSTPLDPGKLPFRVAAATERQPREATERGMSPGVLVARQAPPSAADLAANEDAQLTPEIRALAATLNNSAVEIYHWVRNNIAFVPTYGSVQGSQMTLESQRGNASDTASLLVALLRSAGVPARYATGTVEVPVEAVMNWVGNAASPQVAQQILGQGGVPNVGLTSGGVVTHIRLEHVWVEAFVDFIPGRGATRLPGDSWVPLDASFKQHVFTAESSFFAANPIEPVLDPGDHLFDVDEATGKISNVTDDILDERLALWAEDAELYLAANGIERTFDGLAGRKTILVEASTVLPASLPYAVLNRASSVATLPTSLRHRVTLLGFNSQFDRSFDNPAVTVDLSLPALNSRRLGLQFEPATAADAAVLDAARASGAASLPVYLVRMVPKFKLDGVELGAGSALGMGRTFYFDVVLRGPDGPTTIEYQAAVGDEIVVGVTGNGVTKEVVEKRFAGNPVDNSPEYLHQVQLHYWTECDAMGEIAARALKVHQLRLPSVGVFASPLTVSLLFGTPRSGVYQQRIMDVKQSLIGAAGANPNHVTAFVKQTGLSGSYLEGAVFDQLENDPARPLKGISAVHLINTAMRQGIPIYRITPANAAAAVPLLALSAAVERDITTALAQGKTVMAPEQEMSLGPWRGVGYIIQDETTGAGAYLISGGLAGGGLIECLERLLPILVEVLLIIILIILLIILLWWLAGLLAGALAGAGAAAAAAALFLLLLRPLGPLGGNSA